jgi:competence protein ComFC
MSLFSLLASAIYPNVCQFCSQQRATAAESYICADCRNHPEAVSLMNEPMCDKCGLGYDGAITNKFVCANCKDMDLQFFQARAAAEFAGLVKEVIHRFKYQRNEWFEPYLAELLIASAAADIKTAAMNLIVPIPLHRRKEHERGFNQSERLARRLSEATKIPFAMPLRRVKRTENQALLDRAGRINNVKNAFAYAAEGPLPPGSRVLLVDDVLTTGSTASACAEELLKNGAAEVRVWTVARGGLNQ